MIVQGEEEDQKLEEIKQKQVGESSAESSYKRGERFVLTSVLQVDKMNRFGDKVFLIPPCLNHLTPSFRVVAVVAVVG